MWVGLKQQYKWHPVLCARFSELVHCGSWHYQGNECVSKLLMPSSVKVGSGHPAELLSTEKNTIYTSGSLFRDQHNYCCVHPHPLIQTCHPSTVSAPTGHSCLQAEVRHLKAAAADLVVAGCASYYWTFYTLFPPRINQETKHLDVLHDKGCTSFFFFKSTVIECFF